MPNESMEERARRLVANATPGPWVHQVTTACYDVIQGGGRHTDSVYIAMMGTDFDGEQSQDAPNCRADAEFIAACPSLLTELLGENERLREDADKMRHALRLHWTWSQYQYADAHDEWGSMAGDGTPQPWKPPPTSTSSPSPQSREGG